MLNRAHYCPKGQHNNHTVPPWPSSKAQDCVLGNVIFISGLSKDTYDDRQAI